MAEMQIDERVFEIVQWEIHLRRYALLDIVGEVKAAAQMGMCDEKLLGLVLGLEKDLNETFASLRKYSTRQLMDARLDGWKLPEL